MVKVRRISVKNGKKAKIDETNALENQKSKGKRGKGQKRIELNSKEFKINLEQLQKDVTKAYKSMVKVLPHAAKNLEVKPFGNASHIILPKEFAGKKAVVFIKRD